MTILLFLFIALVGFLFWYTHFTMQTMAYYEEYIQLLEKNAEQDKELIEVLQNAIEEYETILQNAEITREENLH